MCAGAERMSMYVWLTNTKLGMSRLGSLLFFFFFFKVDGMYFYNSSNDVSFLWQSFLVIEVFFDDGKIMGYIFGSQNLNFNYFY